MMTTYANLVASSHCAKQSEYYSNSNFQTSMSAMDASAAGSVIGGLASVVKLQISKSNHPYSSVKYTQVFPEGFGENVHTCFWLQCHRHVV